ncbi:MAG: right-handed parallel beta-helix repeat-containing protein [Chloroflexota bacterium]
MRTISPVTALASLSLAALVGAGSGIVAGAPALAAGTTLVVRSHGDKPDSDPGDGRCATAGSTSEARRCTLRAAIMEANATPEADRIRFAIETGSHSYKTMRPKSALPIITAPLSIDGTTQAGATSNTAFTGTNARMRVVLVGDQAGSAAGLQASAPVTIRGLVIYGFSRGIQLSAGSDGSRIVGSFVGVDRTGHRVRGNHGSGILVNATDVRIGSGARADRNVISANDSAGISLGIAARRATVQGNLIGTQRDGERALGNGGDGVFVTGSSDHLIGGEHAGQGNVIAFNGGNGVSLLPIASLDLVPRKVRILGNSITGNARLGIDLGADGSTKNDTVPDADGGANRLQNKPRRSCPPSSAARGPPSPAA